MHSAQYPDWELWKTIETKQKSEQQKRQELIPGKRKMYRKGKYHGSLHGLIRKSIYMAIIR